MFVSDNTEPVRPLPQFLIETIPGMQCRCPPHQVDQQVRLQVGILTNPMQAQPGAISACPFAYRLSQPWTARPQNCWKQRQSGRYPATCSAAGNGSAAAEGARQDSLADKAAKEEQHGLPPWALTFDLRERDTGAPSLNKTINL